MKRVIAVLLAIGLLAAGASPVLAEEKRITWDMDRLQELPEDKVRVLFGFSPLTSVQDDYSWKVDFDGSTSFQAVLAPCSSIAKIDTNYTTCIEKISYRKTGSASWQSAELSKVQLGQPTTTIQKGKLAVGPLSYSEQPFRPGGDKATLWSMPGARHAAGSDYLIRTRFLSGDNQFGQFTFKAEILPASFPANKSVITQDQIKVAEFPKEFEYKVRLRMGVFNKTLTGWFFGRMINPTINRNGPGGYLEITGEPAFVPIGLTDDLPVSTTDQYFDPTWCSQIKERRASSAYCGSFNRLYNKAFTFTNEEGWEPGSLGRWEKAPGGVRTIATLSSWSLGSSFFRDLQVDTSATKCTTDLYGVDARVFQGAVFSNATMYQTSPPDWDAENNSFVFKVASPHLNEKGSPNKGFYTLYIPTEIAKCRWGEAVSSARAEIQIIYADGKASVTTVAATTQDGNLRFNIAGFGYSSPTIKIRMGKDIKFTADANPKISSSNQKVAIKCTKGKLIKKVLGVNPVCPKGYKRSKI
jgi:hypothetical protein